MIHPKGFTWATILMHFFEYRLLLEYLRTNEEPILGSPLHVAALNSAIVDCKAVEKVVRYNRNADQRDSRVDFVSDIPAWVTLDQVLQILRVFRPIHDYIAESLDDDPRAVPRHALNDELAYVYLLCLVRVKAVRPHQLNELELPEVLRSIITGISAISGTGKHKTIKKRLLDVIPFQCSDTETRSVLADYLYLSRQEIVRRTQSSSTLLFVSPATGRPITGVHRRLSVFTHKLSGRPPSKLHRRRCSAMQIVAGFRRTSATAPPSLAGSMRCGMRMKSPQLATPYVTI